MLGKEKNEIFSANSSNLLLLEISTEKGSNKIRELSLISLLIIGNIKDHLLQI
jgi:hypothetical protein